jgi:hypothetical protein
VSVFVAIGAVSPGAFVAIGVYALLMVWLIWEIVRAPEIDEPDEFDPLEWVWEQPAREPVHERERR